MRYLIVLLVTALVGCSIPILNRGLIHRNGITQYPPELPITVHCQLDECGELQDAIQWWHDQSGRDDLFIMSETEGVSVREDYLPANVAGWVITTSDARTGDALTMEMVLQEDEWTLPLIRHELGHLLRLDDDIFSVEDMSIMSTPHGPWSRLTPLDREIIRRLP